MTKAKRYVVDTNLLVSRLLVPGSVPAQAVARAMETGVLLFSDETMAELAGVLMRRKFDAYVSAEDRRQFLLLLDRMAQTVSILRPVQACRDPEDDKILAVAVNGRADAIITGDEDLLVLDPFLGVPILRPAAFLTPV